MKNKRGLNTQNEKIKELNLLGYSNEQISKLLNLPVKKIRQVISHLKLRSNYDLIVEDNRLKQFMIGSMLGDGSIPKLDKLQIAYKLTLGHSEKQLPYLQWKNDLLLDYDLSNNTITKVISKSDRYKSGECVSFHMKSKSNPYFNNYREMFYKKNKKIVPDFVKDLDAFGLAIWYMDDGWLNKNRPIYWLSTDSFSIIELNELIKILKDNFDLNFTINYGKILRLSEKDNNKFKSIISSFVLPIFNYKLH